MVGLQWGSDVQAIRFGMVEKKLVSKLSGFHSEIIWPNRLKSDRCSPFCHKKFGKKFPISNV